MIKKIGLALIFLVSLSLSVNLLCVYCSYQFKPKNFCPPVRVAHSYTPVPLPKGPYTYLGRGKQAIAFESQDKEHVIKLFYWKKPLVRQWYYRLDDWVKVISPLWTVKLAKKKPEVRRLFTRYVWGMEDLAEEVALESIHFAPTKDPLWVTFIDPQGKEHAVNLAKYPFVLQKKVTLLAEYLDDKLQAEGIEGAQEAINQLCAYFIKRIDMGYTDNPVVFEKNYGFLEGLPRQIDIGKLKKEPTADLEKEKAKVFKNLEHYLTKRYPMLKLYPCPNT